MSEEEQDFYEVLGVEHTATADEIKRAYRKAALASHPDRAPEDQKEAATARFKLVATAYETLSDPSQREEYDMQRSGAGRKGFGSVPSFGGAPSFGFGMGGPSMGPGAGLHDPFVLFNSLFQDDPFVASIFSGGMPSHPRRGHPHHHGRAPPGPFGGHPFAFGPEGPGAMAFGDFPPLFGMGMGPSRSPFPPSSFGMGSSFGSTGSSSMSFSSGASGGGVGVSRSVQHVNINGRMQTIVREVGPDGTETVHRQGPDGESVTVNGVRQTSHPWLTSGQSGTHAAPYRVESSSSASPAPAPLPRSSGAPAQGHVRTSTSRSYPTQSPPPDPYFSPSPATSQSSAHFPPARDAPAPAPPPPAQGRHHFPLRFGHHIPFPPWRRHHHHHQQDGH